MGHCYKVSFWILDKPRRGLFLLQDGRGPGSCHIVADYRDRVGVFYPISARNPAELLSHSLEVMPRNPSSLSWSQGPRTQGVN